MLAVIDGRLDRALHVTRADGRVILVAHSQGAMLAQAALARRHDVDRVHLLTAGAGVAPLTTFAGADRLKTAVAAWWTWALTVCTSAAFIAVLPGTLRLFANLISIPGVAPPRSPFKLVGVLAVPAALLMLLGDKAARLAGFRDVSPALRTLALAGRVAEWVEFSSLQDPVSCGPMLNQVPVAVEVVGNSHLLFLEHTSYHRNPYVLFAIASRMPAISQGERRRQEYASAAAENQRRRTLLRCQSTVLFSLYSAFLIQLVDRLAI